MMAGAFLERRCCRIAPIKWGLFLTRSYLQLFRSLQDKHQCSYLEMKKQAFPDEELKVRYKGQHVRSSNQVKRITAFLPSLFPSLLQEFCDRVSYSPNTVIEGSLKDSPHCRHRQALVLSMGPPSLLKEWLVWCPQPACPGPSHTPSSVSAETPSSTWSQLLVPSVAGNA